MYVYVKNGSIIYKSEEREYLSFLKDSDVYVGDYKETDNLIFENNKVVIYEKSKQFEEDTNKYHLQKELNIEKKKNSDLERIANIKVGKELELKREATEYDRKIYLLRNLGKKC